MRSVACTNYFDPFFLFWTKSSMLVRIERGPVYSSFDCDKQLPQIHLATSVLDCIKTVTMMIIASLKTAAGGVEGYNVSSFVC